MKTYEEMAENVIARYGEYKKEQKRRRTALLGMAGGVCACAVMTVAAVGIYKKSDPPHTTADIAVPIISTEVKDGSGSAGELDINSVIGKEITFTGKEREITYAIYEKYIAENSARIKEQLSLSGVNTDALTFGSPYHHLRLDGMTVSLDWSDVLVWNGGKLVSILTLVNEEGGMYCYVAYGGLGFDDLADFVSEHSGEELIFVYVGETEWIIDKSGNLHSTGNISPEDCVNGYDSGTDYFTAFYNAKNVFAA